MEKINSTHTPVAIEHKNQNDSSWKNKEGRTSGTFLTQENVNGLCHIFGNREDYIRNVETLWVLRDLFLTQCGDSCNPNTDDPLFRVVSLADELIGALLQDNIHFSMDNGRVTHTITE